MNYGFTKMVLGVSAVLALLAFGVVAYEYSEMEKLGVAATNLENEAVTEKQSLESFTSLAKTALNIKGDSEKASEFFIKRDDVVGFLDQIEGIASTTNASVSVASVNEKKTSVNNQSLLSVVVRVEGTYSSVFYALRMLEELPYQTEIQNIRLSAGSSADAKNSKSNMWSADVGLVGIMF